VKLFFCVALFWTSAAFAVVEGEVLKDLTIRHNSDATKDLRMASGKVTVLNFWATWCDACKVELQEMDTQFAALRDKVTFAYVSLDKESTKAAAYFKSRFGEKAAMLDELYVDPKFEIADKLGIDAFPFTIVLDAKGKVVHIQRGFKEGSGSTEKLTQVIRASF
jgi:thiol-disulfide isomerase/thioredoxin